MSRQRVVVAASLRATSDPCLAIVESDVSAFRIMSYERTHAVAPPHRLSVRARPCCKAACGRSLTLKWPRSGPGATSKLTRVRGPCDVRVQAFLRGSPKKVLRQSPKGLARAIWLGRGRRAKSSSNRGSDTLAFRAFRAIPSRHAPHDSQWAAVRSGRWRLPRLEA
jgi:hypothetical protein